MVLNRDFDVVKKTSRPRPMVITFIFLYLLISKYKNIKTGIFKESKPLITFPTH